MRISKKVHHQKSIAILILFILFCIHLGKDFSSKNKNYIIDLQDQIKRILKDEQNSDVFIYKKEFNRIGCCNTINNNRIKLLPDRRYYDPSELYIVNGSFSNKMYIVLPNDYSSSVEKKPSVLFRNKSNRWLKIEHFFSNTNHSKYLSLFQHAPYTPAPDIDDQTIINQAVLKAFVPEYDAFIYQKQDKLIWLIGSPIDKNTEIIFHIYTDKHNLLPAHRVKYGYENKGFRVNDKSEKEQLGKYRVFEKSLPSKYHITSIRTGFNTDGKIIWRDFFLTQFE